MSENSAIRVVLAKLRRERDEIRVKVNLAGKELRDEWDEAELLFAKLQSHSKKLAAHSAEVGHEAAQAGANVLAATELLAEELASAFTRIKRKL